MIKKVSIIFITFLFVLVAGCQPSSQKKQQTKVDKQETFIKEKTKKLKLSKKFYFNQLNDDGKEVYIQMTEAASKFKAQVEVKTLDDLHMLKVRQAFTFDHPEFFWVRDAHVGSIDSQKSRVTFTVPDDAEETYDKIEKTANQIAKHLSSSSDYEKAKYIYDYLLNTTTYGLDAENQQNDIRGVFLGKNALAAGYSHAFTYLATKAGLESFTVTGRLIDKHFEGEEQHLWNGVNINEKYYWVDSTWGDTSMKSLPEQSYDYSLFCVSDDTVQRLQIVDTNLDSYFNKHLDETVWTFPTCSDDSLEYYKANGDYFVAYDGQKFRDYLIQKIDKSSETISVQFESIEAYNAAVNDLNGTLIKDLAHHYKGQVDFNGSANRFSYRIDLHFTRS